MDTLHKGDDDDDDDDNNKIQIQATTKYNTFKNKTYVYVAI